MYLQQGVLQHIVNITFDGYIAVTYGSELSAIGLEDGLQGFDFLRKRKLRKRKNMDDS